MMTVDELEDTILHLRRNNERLRELARDMYDYYVAGTLSACDLCDSALDCENHPAMSCKFDEYDIGSAADDQFADRMHELGIEVDE